MNAIKVFLCLDKVPNYNRFSHRLSLVSPQDAENTQKKDLCGIEWINIPELFGYAQERLAIVPPFVQS
jgi:hypothetical protein